MANNEEIPRIDFEHQRIHDGDMYTFHHLDETLGDNETINIAFKTPAVTTAEIHMVVEWATKVGAILEIKEAATWTAQSGTAGTPINVDRNSSNTSALLGNETTTVFTAGEIAYNVTTILTTNATTIDTTAQWGALSLNANSRGMHEFILKASTTYVILLTAEGASNFGLVRLRWYEYLPNTI